MIRGFLKLSWVFLLAGLLVASCQKNDETPYVVVYTAHDQIYSEPVFQKFTKETGIEVRAVYDTEAVKTAGLVSRLIAEADAPRCDVFWNNEIARTIILKRKGLLQPYVSPQSEQIPPVFRDPEGFWTGFAGRGRVLIYNTDLVKDPDTIPKSLWALTRPEWRGKAAIAKPLFGTTATHAAHLFHKWGDEETRRYFKALKENEVLIAAGNATVRDMVARGRLPLGLTDTDDVNGALEDGLPVGIIYPDSDTDKTLVIPNTLCLMKGAPRPEQGRKLIDYLLTRETEEYLNRERAAQIPLRRDAVSQNRVPALRDLPVEDTDWEKVADEMESTAAFIQNEFL